MNGFLLTIERSFSIACYRSVATATLAAQKPIGNMASPQSVGTRAGKVKQHRGLIETPHAKLDALVYTNMERRGGAAVILHPYALLGGGQLEMIASSARQT